MHKKKPVVMETDEVSISLTRKLGINRKKKPGIVAPDQENRKRGTRSAADLTRLFTARQAVCYIVPYVLLPFPATAADGPDSSDYTGFGSVTRLNMIRRLSVQN
jgi:hypothetical protein